MLRQLVTLTLTVLACAACRSTEHESSAGRDYVLVILRAGPNGAEVPVEQRKEAMAGHMANIQRLADEGVLWIAGPFGQPNPNPARRGLFLFALDDPARATELTATDPAVKAGLLEPEVVALRSHAKFERAHDADMRFVEANRAAGKPPGADFAMHNYVFGFVGGGESAADALSRSSGVLAVGRCNAPREDTNVVWIDAADLVGAEATLAAVRAELGQLDLTPWWGSASLLELAKP